MKGEAIIQVSHKFFQELLYHVTETDIDLDQTIEDMLQPLLTEWGEREKKYGDEKKGYQWNGIFLPNATQLYMINENKVHHAVVKFEKIVYEGESYSPSALARKIANGNKHNAWADLFIQVPRDDVWRRAADMLMEPCI